MRILDANINLSNKRLSNTSKQIVSASVIDSLASFSAWFLASG